MVNTTNSNGKGQHANAAGYAAFVPSTGNKLTVAELAEKGWQKVVSQGKHADKAHNPSSKNGQCVKAMFNQGGGMSGAKHYSIFENKYAGAPGVSGWLDKVANTVTTLPGVTVTALVKLHKGSKTSTKSRFMLHVQLG